jgi:hypothetical protein
MCQQLPSLDVSGARHHVEQENVTNVLKAHASFFFWVVETGFLQNAGNFYHFNTV